MSNIQKQHKISPAIAWLTIQKFIIFYCPLDGEHTTPKTPGVLHLYMFEKAQSAVTAIVLWIFFLTNQKQITCMMIVAIQDTG